MNSCVSLTFSVSPFKFANSLLLFAKGLGWLTSLATPGVERQRSSSQASIGSGGAGTGAGGRRMSMEEYDKPNIREGGAMPIAADWHIVKCLWIS